jgi:hypothetical protein
MAERADLQSARRSHSGRGLFALILALLVVPGGVGLATCARAEGPLEFGAALGSSWYDHRALVAADYSLRTFRPYLRYGGPLAGWEVDAGAQTRFEFYSGDADSVVGSGRHTNDRFRAAAVRRWSEHDDLAFEAGYLRTHDVLDDDLSAIVADGKLVRLNGGVETHAGMFEGMAHVRSTDYERPGLSDGLSLGGTARLFPLRQAVHSAYVGFDATQLDVAHRTALASKAATLGYRRAVDPLLTAEVEAGGVEHHFDDGGRERKFLFGLGLERDPRRVGALAASLHARFEGDSLASVAALARYALASGRAWLSATSTADAEGGLFRSATRTQRIALGVEDTLARANVLGVETSYARGRPFRGEGASTSVLRASAWALRRVQPWLNARIAASYLREPFGTSGSPVLRRIRLEAELIVLSGGFAG